jgi:uncharacterized protein YceK
MKWLKVVAIVLCPILLIGCASIISGRTQKVGVTTIPAEAVVICNGMTQSSPCTLILDRTQPVYQITIKKEGYKTIDVKLERGINGWVFGNIVLGGIIGLVIDVADGSCWQFYPGEISQNLSKDEVVIKVK